MGDLQACLPHQIAFLPPAPAPAPAPQVSQPANPLPSEIAVNSWRAAERATQGVVESIQATVVSEQRRQEVIEHVQKLIRYHLSCEVFPFGSVPLKTYLPDGDIDLTALGYPYAEDMFATNVRQVLEMEEHNNDREFEVKDVQYIHAEVKLVKCLVQNIVVDISFNQSGGLSTLCFLEQVDRVIGKDHLFKRSIILIKAWCYYESRILGAHHGLISTYALEILVLYIFHLFHSSLDDPLAVLYRFLDYYSKFDWDAYCISLYGPVLASSLPDLVAEAPENDGVDLLFSKEFLKKCAEEYSVIPKGFESTSRTFHKKHLNIVDPLRENNNLGRSVSRGNFYRIRSAFSYGARKLGRILLLPSESIAMEMSMFFSNTLDRHGNGERPDVPEEILVLSESTSMNENGTGSSPSELQNPCANVELSEQMNTVKLSVLEKLNGNRVESDDPVEGRYSVGPACKGPSSGKEKSKLSASTTEREKSPNGKVCHIPHLFFHSDNGCKNRPSQASPSNFIPSKSVPSLNSIPSIKDSRIFRQPKSCETESSTSSASLFSTNLSVASSCNPGQLENSHTEDSSFSGAWRNGARGSPKSKKLADLGGNFDLHITNLSYVQWSQEYIMGNVPLLTKSHSFQFGNKTSWDAPRRHGAFAHMNTNRVAAGSPFSPSGTYPTRPFISGAYNVEDLPKPRGTGTYFPNTNYQVYRERQSPGRGTNQLCANHLSRQHSNGWAETTQEGNSEEKGGNEPPLQLHLPVFSGNVCRKTTLLDVSNSIHTSNETSHANSSVFPSEGELEFGSFGPIPVGTSSSEPDKKLDPALSRTKGSGLIVPASALRRSLTSPNRERSSQAYRLKDEADFPPLTG